MYLDDGRWRSKQIVPVNWVHASTRTQVRVPSGQGVTAGYGYNWWIDERKPGFFAAHGYLGQALVVFPELDLVVVVTSFRDDLATGFTIARVIAKGDASLRP